MLIKKSEDQFLVKLIEFYKKTIGDSANSVSVLKEIQVKFPKKYAALVRLQENPDTIMNLSEKMKPEVRKILFELMFKAALLSKKMGQMFEMSVKDKELLIKDLKVFSNEMEENLNTLKEKGKKENV